MGIFDRVFSEKKQPESVELTQAEAFAAVALAASAADGHISQVEIQGMVPYLRRMQLYANHNGQQLGDMFDKLLRMLKRDGVGALVAASKDILPIELKETAFALAVDIVLADGVVEEDEKDFLQHLQQALGLSDDLTIKIIEVMMIKNRG